MPFTLNIFAGNPLCAENCTGQIGVTASGTPVLPITYTLYPGGATNTTGSFTGLCPGNYIITGLDSAGDRANETATLVAATPIDFSVTALGLSITINAIGGTPPYQYAVDGGPLQASNNFLLTEFGNHVVTVVDSKGCTQSSTIAVEPPLTFGFMNATSYIYQNSSNSDFFGCLQTLVPGMRVRLCFNMNTNGYNTAVINNGIAGDFDTNFVGIGTILTDTLPTVQELQNYTISLDAPFEVVNPTGAYGGCSEFRIPEGWTGVNYFIAVYVFEITLPSGFTYTDKVAFRVPITVKPLDDGSNFTGELQDLNGDPIDSLCDNPTNPDARFCFSSSLPQLFDSHFLLLEGDEVLQEEDPYGHFQMIEYDSDIMFNADSDTAGGDACVDVDVQKLPPGDYCVRGIFIGQGPPTQGTCPCIEVELTRNIDPFNASGVASATLQYNIPGVLDSEVEEVRLFMTPKPGPLGTSSDASDTFNYQACESLEDDMVAGVVTLTNGCVYEIPDSNFGVPINGPVTLASPQLGLCCAEYEVLVTDNGDGTFDLTANLVSGSCPSVLYFWFGDGPTGDQTITVGPGTYTMRAICSDSCSYDVEVTV